MMTVIKRLKYFGTNESGNFCHLKATYEARAFESVIPTPYTSEGITSDEDGRLLAIEIVKMFIQPLPNSRVTTPAKQVSNPSGRKKTTMQCPTTQTMWCSASKLLKPFSTRKKSLNIKRGKMIRKASLPESWQDSKRNPPSWRGNAQQSRHIGMSPFIHRVFLPNILLKQYFADKCQTNHKSTYTHEILDIYVVNSCVIVVIRLRV